MPWGAVVSCRLQVPRGSLYVSGRKEAPRVFGQQGQQLVGRHTAPQASMSSAVQRAPKCKPSSTEGV